LRLGCLTLRLEVGFHDRRGLPTGEGFYTTRVIKANPA
jgi:hypothetical protein